MDVTLELTDDQAAGLFLSNSFPPHTNASRSLTGEASHAACDGDWAVGIERRW